MNIRPPCAWVTRSWSPAAIPSSSVSTASAIAASSGSPSEHSYSEQRARRVAITIALEPPSPTPRGIEVETSIAVRAAAGSRSRPKRATVARTSSLLGETSSAAAGHANACARRRASVSARTAPPYPSDGLPAIPARARASPPAISRRVILSDECGGSGAQRGSKERIAQRVVDDRRAIAVDGPDVVAPLAPAERDRNHASTRGDHGAQRRGELDLSAVVGLQALERGDHVGAEDGACLC